MAALERQFTCRAWMFGFTRQQWFALTISGAIGFVALYLWLDYGFWESLAIEAGLVGATIGMHMWKISRQIPPS